MNPAAMSAHRQALAALDLLTKNAERAAARSLLPAVDPLPPEVIELTPEQLQTTVYAFQRINEGLKFIDLLPHAAPLRRLGQRLDACAAAYLKRCAALPVQHDTIPAPAAESLPDGDLPPLEPGWGRPFGESKTPNVQNWKKGVGGVLVFDAPGKRSDASNFLAQSDAAAASPKSNTPPAVAVDSAESFSTPATAAPSGPISSPVDLLTTESQLAADLASEAREVLSDFVNEIFGPVRGATAPPMLAAQHAALDAKVAKRIKKGKKASK